MSEAKFTKGKWVIGGDGQSLSSVWSDNECVCRGINFDFNADNEELETHHIEAKANAHLIAAAPDMYKEIESEISILEGQLIDAETHGEASRLQDRIIRKVNLLAKARGES